MIAADRVEQLAFGIVPAGVCPAWHFGQFRKGVG
jgi:hypothetical protein